MFNLLETNVFRTNTFVLKQVTYCKCHSEKKETRHFCVTSNPTQKVFSADAIRLILKFSLN